MFASSCFSNDGNDLLMHASSITYVTWQNSVDTITVLIHSMSKYLTQSRKQAMEEIHRQIIKNPNIQKT